MTFSERDQAVEVKGVSLESDIEEHADGMGQDLGVPQILQVPDIAYLQVSDMKSFSELRIDGFDQTT